MRFKPTLEVLAPEDLIRIHEASLKDVVQLVGSTPVDPCDVEPNQKHLHIMYEILKHTDKPLIGNTARKHQVAQMMKMLAIVLGDDNWQENHWIGVAVNPLSPLAFTPDALETIIEYAKRNQIIFIPPAIMAGVCGPMGLLGTIVLQNSEILGGLVLTQLINPGTPVVYTAAGTVSYMKRANYNTGAPELPLIHAAGLKMGRDFYHLPTDLCVG
ncbi:MAG: trimethylamine methyltransferase family protein [Desulfitobacteriaceae bacterium]|nr:trimethylamine methyltransferase family protein [Desulfitobacteriaceae bacterium]